jgi:hypothetical protein
LAGDPPADEREEDEMSETETEAVTCLFPGCENPAVPPPKHGGPPPRYCEDENHNAGTTYAALNKDKDPAADGEAAG